MTIFEKIRIKEITNDTVSTIANSLKWDYENILESKKVNLNVIENNCGICDDETAWKLTIIDTKLEIYDKVFALLEKL